MGLHQSGEMYLETIYILKNETGAVRSLDVAEHMGFSKPSVSRAVKLLKTEGYITVDESGLLFLTEEGEKIAKTMYERHTILTEMFVSLGVDAETAADDACKIEHSISDRSFEAIKKHLLEKIK